jgi:DNA-binding transcriptional regulator YiaG
MAEYAEFQRRRPDLPRSTLRISYKAMTPVELRAALESLNLTHQQLARLLGYDERTMRYWLAGDRGIPSAVLWCDC